MAGKQQVLLAVFLLTAAAFTSALEDVGQPKPSNDMIPPAPYVTTVASPLVNTTKSTTHTTTSSPPPPHNTTTSKPTTPTHNTTTAKPTTPTHNTTTSKPTTPHHNTTTAKPTTPHHNTTTAKPTTPAHNTTTTKTTTVAPTPTPSTNATVGNYTVKDGNNLCIMVQAVIEVQVNNSEAAGNYIVQPGTTKFKGTCEKTSASLNLILTEGNIFMTFTRNDTEKRVYVSSVAVDLTYAFKAGASYRVNSKNNTKLFSMATGHSYSCKSESVFLGNGTSLKFSQNRMQAFNFTQNQFGPFDLCKADTPDYRVAIGVGIVLLILIIIVILAYIISRRKRTDGYQSL